MPEANRNDTALRELRALEEIERNPRISQRQLAGELGVALGVANACVQTLARKGLLKIRGDSNRSLSYHLTKEGVLRKAALAVEWTNNTIGDYVQAKASLREKLSGIAALGVERVVILGATEAAELVALIAPQVGVAVVAAVPVEGKRIADVLAGVPVLEPADVDTAAVDAFITTVSDVRPESLGIDSPGLPVFTPDGQRLERSVS